MHQAQEKGNNNIQKKKKKQERPSGRIDLSTWKEECSYKTGALGSRASEK
jgi:hypothetical protein